MNGKEDEAITMASTATFRNSTIIAARASLSPSLPQENLSQLIESKSSPELECDYDIAPTELYQAIEAQQWEHVLNLLKSSDNNGDAATQAATWVLRKETNGKLRWRLLPIHAAVIFRAPVNVIETLLTKHAPGVQCKDDQGMLPIHLAFRNNAPNAVLDALLSAHPSCINNKDRKGRTPIQCALSSNAEESNKSRANLIQTYATLSVESERANVLSESDTSFERKMNAFKSEHDNSVTSEKERVVQREAQDSKKIQELTTTLEQCTDEVTTLRSDLSAREEEVKNLTRKVAELTVALEESSLALSNAESEYVKDTEALKKERDSLLSRADGLSLSHSIVVSDLSALKQKKTQDIQKEKGLEENIEKLQQKNVLLGEEKNMLENEVLSLQDFMRTLTSDMDRMREIILKQERDMKAAAIVHQRMLSAAAKSETELHQRAEKERDLLKQILDEKKKSLEGILSCNGVKKGLSPSEAVDKTSNMEGALSSE